MADTSPLNKVSATPDLALMLDLFKRQVLLDLNCHAIATVVSFNSELQTATVKLNYPKLFSRADPITGVYKDVAVDYPPLQDCPVIVLQGGAGSLTFPITPGDSCLVLFNDRDIDKWFSSDQLGQPVATQRLHSFADALVLVGLNASPNAIETYDPTRTELRNDNALLSLSAQKVKISNDITTLLTLLNGLIDLQIAIVNQLIPVTGMTAPNIAANAAALAAYKLILGGLLE